MPIERLLDSFIVRVCLRHGVRRIRLQHVGSGETRDFCSYRELSAYLADHEEGASLGAAREAARRSEARLFGDAPPATGAGPHRVLLARTTAASRPSSIVALRAITDELAWRRYLSAREQVEAVHGLDAQAVRGIVERMRSAAARYPVRWYFVVNGEGVEVGAVGCLSVTASGTRYWRLQDVDIFPAYRRRGYGNELLDAVVALAAADRAAAVIVAADEDDWPLAWYERRAFVRVATVAMPTTPAFAATPS